jgi:hypothetical protein
LNAVEQELERLSMGNIFKMEGKKCMEKNKQKVCGYGETEYRSKYQRENIADILQLIE